MVNDEDMHCGTCKHMNESCTDPEDRCYKCLESEEPDEFWEPLGVSCNG